MPKNLVVICGVSPRPLKLILVTIYRLGKVEALETASKSTCNHKLHQ